MASHSPGADSRRARRAFASLAALCLAAAAAPALAQPAVGPEAQAAAVPAIPDPWERTNRKLYGFSMAVDRAVIAPGIHAYRRVAPGPFQTGLRNAVDNLDEPRIAGNDVLQGHLDKAGAAAVRFLVNSTLGIGGLIDVAGRTGLPRHDSDFGQTLARYGAGTGPYIFVPFAGPSDVRDGFGRIVDAVGNPVAWVTGGLDTTQGQVRTGIGVFQARVDIDDQLTGLDRDFTDPYATLRSGYSQNRAFKVREARGESPAAAVSDLPDFGTEAPSESPPAQ